MGGKGERLQQLLPKGELLGPVANKGQGEGAGLRDSKRWGRHSLACMYALGGGGARECRCARQRGQERAALAKMAERTGRDGSTSVCYIGKS